MILNRLSIRWMSASVNRKRSLNLKPNTFHYSIYEYLSNSSYCKKLYTKFNSFKKVTFSTDRFDMLDTWLYKDFTKNDKILLDPEVLIALPAYISKMSQRQVTPQLVNNCDIKCTEILELQSHEDLGFTIFELLHAWLTHFHPTFDQIQGLRCYPNLLQERIREVSKIVIQNNSTNIDPECIFSLVYLAFVAGIGKTNVFESHEVLSRLATLCDSYPNQTYRNMSPTDLAVICVSFFRSGVKLESVDFLSYVSSSLCQLLLSSLSQPNKFNSFVTVSLLKTLRQTNYVDSELLKLLSETLLSPALESKVRHLPILSHAISAFVGPGKRTLSSSNSTTDLSVVQVLNRTEHLVVDIMRDEEERRCKKKTSSKTASVNVKEGVESLTKSRLKHISRWIWTAASLGYQINLGAYEADFDNRFTSGEYVDQPSDAVDAMLALVIMNHYLDDIVMKTLRCPEFRHAVKVQCSSRHKGRFGLLLTSVKIERSDLWRQLSTDDVSELMEIIGSSLMQNETAAAWTPEHLPHKAWRDKTSNLQLDTMKDYRPHSDLLNQCMDALNEAFPPIEENRSSNGNIIEKKLVDVANGSDEIPLSVSVSLSSEKNERTVALEDHSDRSRVKVLRGNAVPYLFVPGIKVILLDVGKEICVEVLDDQAISPGLHAFKLRLLAKMGLTVFEISRDEIDQCPNLAAYFQTSVERLL